MIDPTKPHNWIIFLVMLLVVGFLLAQIGNRVPAVQQLRAASGIVS